MLRYLMGNDLDTFPLLRDSMFKDRAQQFRQRLGWEVAVDDQGWERDHYDTLNPVYIIWQQSNGSHGGSMRFFADTGADDGQ